MKFKEINFSIYYFSYLFWLIVVLVYIALILFLNEIGNLIYYAKESLNTKEIIGQLDRFYLKNNDYFLTGLFMMVIIALIVTTLKNKERSIQLLAIKGGCLLFGSFSTVLSTPKDLFFLFFPYSLFYFIMLMYLTYVGGINLHQYRACLRQINIKRYKASNYLLYCVIAITCLLIVFFLIYLYINFPRKE